MKFVKPALSIDEQIDLLRRRGLRLDDPDAARHTLAHISYYRLRAYWQPLEAAQIDHSDRIFRPGARFEDVVAHYVFDQRLKLLLMDAIERVEIALRARWGHQLAMRYGSHAYLDGDMFSCQARHAKCVRLLREEVARSHEPFVRDYAQTFSDPDLPPIWIISEVLTFGQLSQWVDNLRHRSDRQAIARAFGFDEVVLCAFVHHLAMVRNVCAHHGRVWNRRFTIRMKLPARPSVIADWFNAEQDSRIYNTLLMLGLILERICPESKWTHRLLGLVDSSPTAMQVDMGFPQRWRVLPLWTDASAVAIARQSQ